MAISIEQVGPGFVGRVSGADARQPLSAEDIAAVERGMDQYAVLVFPGQDITDDQQVAFSEQFGTLEDTKGGNVTKREELRLSPKLADVSNLDKDGKPLARDDRRRMFNLGNQLWHSDSSFRATPAKYSILSGRRVTIGEGNTEFADMRAAYDALDPKTKAEVEGLVCEHSLIYSRGTLGFSDLSDEERAMFTPVRQVLVRTHPVSGRKSLYLSSHIGTIIGWPMPEARAFIRDLIEHATKPDAIYVHQWQPYDLLMWDNRQTMHRVRRFDATQVRDMRRTTLRSDGPTYVQAAAAE